MNIASLSNLLPGILGLELIIRNLLTPWILHLGLSASFDSDKGLVLKRQQWRLALMSF